MQIQDLQQLHEQVLRQEKAPRAIPEGLLCLITTTTGSSKILIDSSPAAISVN